MQQRDNGLKILKKTKDFIYLISPNKINFKNFYKKLEILLKTKKISFFQLRLKTENKNKIFNISKKIKKITNKYNVKFIINDDPNLAIKINADGCHIGQKDYDIKKARKILKNKILGVTCHNSIKLVKKAIKDRADYVALGSFFKTKTKKIKHRANLNMLKWCKKTYKITVVAIGGINNRNCKKLLLNRADFLAISGYIWNNKKLKPEQAIQNF